MTLTDTHDPLHKTTEDLVTEAPILDAGLPAGAGVVDQIDAEILPYDPATEVPWVDG